MRQWCYSDFLSGTKDARTPQAAPPEQWQAVVKTLPWQDNTNLARRAHVVQYVREFFMKWVQSCWSEAWVMSLWAWCWRTDAFGLCFDFITELHTDLHSLLPKIVFNDHGMQKQSLALSQSTILRYFSKAFPFTSSLWGFYHKIDNRQNNLLKNQNKVC